VQLLLEKEVKLDQGNLIEDSLQSQFVISEPESIENPLEVSLPALIQTWDWPDAELAISKTKAVIEISDRSADALARKNRLQLIHKVVLSLLEVAGPIAIH
jgi:hypothetical protein